MSRDYSLPLAVEAGLRRDDRTRNHTGHRDLFYALVKARSSGPERVFEAA